MMTSFKQNEKMTEASASVSLLLATALTAFHYFKQKHKKFPRYGSRSLKYVKFGNFSLLFSEVLQRNA